MPDQVAIFKDGKPLSEKLALSLELVERMQNAEVGQDSRRGFEREEQWRS